MRSSISAASRTMPDLSLQISPPNNNTQDSLFPAAAAEASCFEFKKLVTAEAYDDDVVDDDYYDDYGLILDKRKRKKYNYNSCSDRSSTTDSASAASCGSDLSHENMADHQPSLSLGLENMAPAFIINPLVQQPPPPPPPPPMKIFHRHHHHHQPQPNYHYHHLYGGGRVSDEFMKRNNSSRMMKRNVRAPRMRWTSTLHAHFVHAVQLLGGHESTYVLFLCCKYKLP